MHAKEVKDGKEGEWTVPVKGHETKRVVRSHQCWRKHHYHWRRKMPKGKRGMLQVWNKKDYVKRRQLKCTCDHTCYMCEECAEDNAKGPAKGDMESKNCRDLHVICAKRRRTPAGRGTCLVPKTMTKKMVPFDVQSAMSVQKERKKTGWFLLKGMRQEKCFVIINAEAKPHC